EKLKDYRNQITGAESQEDFAKRIRKAFTEVTSVVNYSTIGIVTHGMPFWVIFGDILNDNGIVSVGDCAYAVLNKEGQKLTTERLDGIEHRD
ncbi:MAG: histidine phosphatase family protein, partial [Patescibacteria group bacterium]